MQVHRLARELQGAAERGKAGAEGEDRGEEQALVDAERADHLAVLRRGAHQRAPARLLEQEPEQAEHDRPDDDQEELVAREAAAHQHDEALEAGRARPELVLRPPDAERDVLHHQHEAEGGEQLEQLRRLVDPAQDHDLDERAERRDDDSRQQDAAPEAERIGRAEAGHQREGEIGAQHVEGTVREVHDPRHAEDDRQPAGDEEERRGRGQAVERLREDQIDHARFRRNNRKRAQSSRGRSAPPRPGQP